MFSKKNYYYSSTVFFFLLIDDKEKVLKTKMDSLGFWSVHGIILLTDFFKLMWCKKVLFFSVGSY